jgi:hypothetical protein
MSCVLNVSSFVTYFSWPWGSSPGPPAGKHTRCHGALSPIHLCDFFFLLDEFLPCDFHAWLTQPRPPNQGAAAHASHRPWYLQGLLLWKPGALGPRRNRPHYPGCPLIYVSLRLATRIINKILPMHCFILALSEYIEKLKFARV